MSISMTKLIRLKILELHATGIEFIFIFEVLLEVHTKYQRLSGVQTWDKFMLTNLRYVSAEGFQLFPGVQECTQMSYDMDKGLTRGKMRVPKDPIIVLNGYK